MHILLITDNFYPEGNAIASRVYERACYWVKWNHQVTVITSAPNFPEGKLYPGYQNKWFQKENLNSIKVIRVKTFIRSNQGFFLRILDFLSFMFPAFIAGLWQKKPDVIVTTSPQFFGAISACFVAKCKRAPFVLELGDLWPAFIVGVGAMKKSKMILFLEKIELMLYRHADRIIVVSPDFKNNLTSRFVPAEKIDVILNGVDLEKYSPKPRDLALAAQYHIAADDFVVGYIGTQGLGHALENVLETALQLMPEKKLKIMFVGAGAKRESLIKKAEQLGLTNILFVPPQPKFAINQFWSLCNVALVHFKNTPIFSASIPSKIFEAMGMGLPILLASPKGAASNIVLSEQVGLWVPAENPIALEKAILALYHDREALKQFSKNSLAASQNHSREYQAKVFIDVLKTTCAIC